jgi:tRNA 2-thiocytidine biosynthesis protein TtcA
MKTAGKDTGQTMEDYEISVQELSKRDADSYILIDIRDDSSYSYGNIPGSLHVPKDILEADYEKYKDKPLILYCKKGETSAETVQFLKEKNIEAKSLKGGYLAWLMESMKQEEEQQDAYLDIEQSIRKKFKKSIWCKFTKAVREYELVKEGDKIAVCISGGKDSMLMAKLFQELQRHNRFPFEVTFLVMDPGYSKENRQIIENNAKKLHIPLTIFESDIFEAVLHVEKSPCYLCARMRRGHLYAKAKELGCNKIALGHHYDDVIETILMGMLYGAQVQTMMPKLHSTNFEGMELIRPLYLVREDDIKKWRDYNDLHFLQCACKFTETCSIEGGDSSSKRMEIKHLIRELKKTNPFVEGNIFKSVENVNLSTVIAYKQNGVKHHFLESYDDVAESRDVKQ